MMGVRIFLSNGSGNKEIENSQQRIQMVLTTRAIQFVTIDISAPGMQEMRSFMREKGRKREGQRNALPPQIFNGEECRGDYEGFDIANEDDDLEEFLGIPRKNPKAAPVKTGAVAPEIGKLNPGKLMKDQIATKNTQLKEIVSTAENKESGSEGKGLIKGINEDNNKNNAFNGDILNKKDGKNGNGNENDNKEGDNVDENTIIDENCNSKTEKMEDEVFQNFKTSVEEEAVKNEADKVFSKTDGLTGHINANCEMISFDKASSDTEDSSDESSDEDTAIEYMPDGELVRKKSRGFKQLNNCKRFWKASLMVE